MYHIHINNIEQNLLNALVMVQLMRKKQNLKILIIRHFKLDRFDTAERICFLIPPFVTALAIILMIILYTIFD